MRELDLALVFENPQDGTALQFEKDTDGYSITVYGEGTEATVFLNAASLIRLTNFMTDIINEGV
jgi:hypothetical protein